MVVEVSPAEGGWSAGTSTKFSTWTRGKEAVARKTPSHRVRFRMTCPIWNPSPWKEGWEYQNFASLYMSGSVKKKLGRIPRRLMVNGGHGFRDLGSPKRSLGPLDRNAVFAGAKSLENQDRYLKSGAQSERTLMSGTGGSEGGERRKEIAEKVPAVRGGRKGVVDRGCQSDADQKRQRTSPPHASTGLGIER